jgi:queuine/archaeosine tRNA-ribosyltransferase
MPSEVFLDDPEEPPSSQEKPWSDLESSHNRRKNRPNEVQDNLEVRLQNAFGAVQGTQNRSTRLAGAKENIVPGQT